MPKENEIQKTKLLIVEGNHERDFFSAWFDQLGNTEIQIMPIGGKTQLAENLKPLIKQEKFADVVSLVIIRDADANPAGAFQSVCSALAGVALPIPTAEEQFITLGALLEHQPANEASKIGLMRVAVVITPCNGRRGALEELLLETAAADPLSSTAASYIDGAVATLNENHVRPAPPLHRHGKAKIHAFLATFEGPDKDPGKAALAGAWDFNHPALDPIRTILEQM